MYDCSFGDGPEDVRKDKRSDEIIGRIKEKQGITNKRVGGENILVRKGGFKL